MSGSDLVLVVAALFTLAAAGVGYLFALNIKRQYAAASNPVAAGEEASDPFDRERGLSATDSIRESLSTIFRAARKKGPATDLRIPTSARLVQYEKERESA